MSTPKYISLDNLIHYDANIKSIIPTKVSVSSGGISTVDGNYIGIYKVIGY